eukprot:RCo051032
MSKGLALVFAEDNYECLELHYPRLRLTEAGFTVHVVAPEKNKVYKSKEGYWATSTILPSEVNPAEVKAVIVPGGFCTDRLRRYPECCELLRACYNDGKGSVVGFICHGGWLAISAKILPGRRITCFHSIKDDLVNAGATFVNERCVVDGRMVTAQTPEDLPAFMAAILKLLAAS